MIFWNGLFPFIFTNQQEKKTTAKGENSNSNATKIYSTITFVRGTLNVEKILTDACNVRNEISRANAQAEQEAKSRFGVRRWRSGASDVRSNFRWPVRRRCVRLLGSC